MNDSLWHTARVLLRSSTLEGIRAGTITLAFRRWKRPTVRAGGRLRTAIGELAIEAVDRVPESSLTDDAARAAGLADAAELRAVLDGREGALYRVRLSYAGQDARIALRERTSMTPDERAELADKLQRMDARSEDGAWTHRYLRLIERHPARRAPELAAELGMETPPFKARVRRLKELGLTESLEVGYRLSPRGQAYLK
jgi:hypothetical protein